MISHKLKLIFPRIGKNASTSIINYFKQFDNGLIDEGHDMIIYGIDQYLKNITKKGYNINEYFKFAVVRNPYDKLVSAWYEYKKPNRFLNMKYKKPLANFSDFILFAKNKAHPHWKPQYDILYDNNEKCLVNYIARFENLEDHIRIICNLNGIKFNKNMFLKDNISNRNHYSYYYDSNTKNIVKNMFIKDLEKFEYEF